MFFTRVGTFIAYLVFALGVIRAAIGFWFAVNTESMEANVAAAQRYLGAANTGEAINESMIYIVIAVALGILCEISRRGRSEIRM